VLTIADIGKSRRSWRDFFFIVDDPRGRSTADLVWLDAGLTRRQQGKKSNGWLKNYSFNYLISVRSIREIVASMQMKIFEF
jgi:hypothetical protein